MTGLPPLRHTRIIAFGHKSRQGKDTAIRAFEELAGGRARRFGFSDALYALCRVQHGMTAKDPLLLQEIGVARRQLDPDVWVRACLWAIQSWDADAVGAQVALIGDLRFPNEAAAIRELGGRLVRVRRWEPGGERLYISRDRPPDHISEIALDAYEGWDHTLENDSGDLDAFRHKAHWLAHDLEPEVFRLPRQEAA